VRGQGLPAKGNPGTEGVGNKDGDCVMGACKNCDLRGHAARQGEKQACDTDLRHKIRNTVQDKEQPEIGIETGKERPTATSGALGHLSPQQLQGPTTLQTRAPP